MLERKTTEPDRENIRWGAERRMEFIEFTLYWEGRINRADLTRTFNISNPQASSDFTRYIEKAPGNMDYDRSAKHYFATPRFKPALIVPDADHYLMQLRLSRSASACLCFSPSEMPSGLEAEVVSLPSRSIEPEILRRLLRAIKSGNALRVAYQSMNRPQSTLRWITPHALGFDGFRWHIRAYCHEANAFKDFLLSRVFAIQEERPNVGNKYVDYEWDQYVTLKIGPHPGLSEAQKEIIASEYGMIDGVAALSVRLALAFYLIWNLRLEEGDIERPPKSQQIVLLNREEINREIDKLRNMASETVEPTQ